MVRHESQASSGWVIGTRDSLPSVDPRATKDSTGATESPTHM